MYRSNIKHRTYLVGIYCAAGTAPIRRKKVYTIIIREYKINHFIFFPRENITVKLFSYNIYYDIERRRKIPSNKQYSSPNRQY